MIRHIVSWNYKSGFSPDQNKENALRIKKELEDLIWKIDGIIELQVYTDVLASSNRDIVLNSLFESEEVLDAYHINPAHKAIASFIDLVMQDRICVDCDE